MRLLLDTHILLWALVNDRRLSGEARALINDDRNELLFGAVSIAEVAVKHVLDRPNFRFAPEVVQRQLVHDGHIELPLTGDQAVVIKTLPRIHNDPFDRMLIAQAGAEGVRLVSADGEVARYGAVVLAV